MNEWIPSPTHTFVPNGYRATSQNSRFDFFEIAYITLPLLIPAASALGIDLVWFGVMIGMNLQTSFLTPPFGFSLFYLRGVTPKEIPTTKIYRSVIQLIGLLVICIWPEIVSLIDVTPAG